MGFVERTTDDPGDVGRALDQQASVGNDNDLWAQIAGPLPSARPPGVVRQFVKKTGMADNIATEVFKVTTTNEAGSNDGGVYEARMAGGLAVHGSGPTGETAVMYFWFSAGRAMNGTGAGVNGGVGGGSGAVAASAAATKSIATVTWTMVEVSEYEVSFRCAVDLTGTTITTAEVYAMVEVTYAGFTTPPVILSAG